jgi:hypothetical protein
LMKAAVPVLLHGEAGDLHRAPQHLQAIEPCGNAILSERPLLAQSCRSSTDFDGS